MIGYTRRTQGLAVCLSALAGYVDATAYIQLGGFFVSFMSGNTTRVGVGLAAGSAEAVAAGGLIATFVLGVVAGSLAGRWATVRRRSVILLLVSLLLAAAAVLTTLGWPWLAAIPMALAMGAENAVFEEDGEIGIGLTYMTGTLVKAGQRIASALTGGPALAWAPYLLLWLGLALGGLLGAATHAALGAGGLWLAAAAAAALAITSARIGPDRAG